MVRKIKTGAKRENLNKRTKIKSRETTNSFMLEFRCWTLSINKHNLVSLKILNWLTVVVEWEKCFDYQIFFSLPYTHCSAHSFSHFIRILFGAACMLCTVCDWARNRFAWERCEWEWMLLCVSAQFWCWITLFHSWRCSLLAFYALFYAVVGVHVVNTRRQMERHRNASATLSTQATRLLKYFQLIWAIFGPVQYIISFEHSLDLNGATLSRAIFMILVSLL